MKDSTPNLTKEREKSLSKIKKWIRGTFSQGLSFPFENINKCLPLGIPVGQITTIYGALGCGKTTFAWNILFHGVSLGKQFIYYSLDEKQAVYGTTQQAFHKKRWKEITEKEKEIVDKELIKGVSIKTKISKETFEKEIEGHDYVVIDYFNSLFSKTEGWLGEADDWVDFFNEIANKKKIGIILIQQAGKNANSKTRNNAIIEISEIEGSHRLAAVCPLIISIGYVSDEERAVNIAKQRLQRNGSFIWNLFKNSLERWEKNKLLNIRI